MAKLSRVTVVVGILVGSGTAVSATMMGCSGDDTVAQQDASTDVTTDTGNDVVIGPDVGPDAKPGDGGDAGEGGMTVKEFVAQQETLLCQRMATCCFGVDASAFDTPKCLDIVKTTAIEGNTADLNDPKLDVSKVVVDQTKALSCIAGAKTFACPSMTDTEYRNDIQNCFGAVTGIVPTGGGCNVTVECAPGNYCKAGAFVPPDAGADAGDGGDSGAPPKGGCVALAGASNACQGGAFNEACMYRGYLGQPSLRCDTSNFDGGAPSNTCLPKYPNGNKCAWDWDCTSELCSSGGTCVPSATIVAPFVCTYLTKDGG